MLRRTIGLVVILSMIASHSRVLAQSASQTANENSGALQEVLVTAEKRTENLQTLPNAISVFTGQQLDDAGINGVAGLTLISPSLIWGNSAGEPHLTIRGIGNELINIGADPGVTISRDGVPLVSSLMFQRDFLDTASVEVLRGPQGTVSGRNSPGGAVNIYSEQPTATPQAEVSLGYGNFSRIQTTNFVSGPISGDSLLGRLAVSYVKDDGWLDNTYLNERSMSLDNLHLRTFLTYKPSDTFDVSLILDGFQGLGFDLAGVDAGRVQPDIPSLSEYYLGHPSFDMNNLTFQQDNPGPFHTFAYQATLRADWKFGTSGELTSITGWQDFWQHGPRDYDATPLPISDSYLVEDISQISQELTYVTGLGQRADLVVGGLFLEQHASEPFGIGSPPAVPIGTVQFYTHQEVKSYAAYAQWRYKLTNALRLTLGARETRDEKTYDQTLVVAGAPTVSPTAKGSWNAFTPRLALDYTPTDSVTYYANIARGFTSGGFNTFSGQKFAPEYVWSYEVGVKSYWLDRRLKVNLSAFHSDFKDIQTVLFLPVEGGVTTSLSVENAGAAKIDGIEAELETTIGDRLRLTANATWLDARYTQLESVDGSVPQEGVLNLAGNKLPRAPNWQANVGANYTAPVSREWELNFVANYAWQDRIYFNFFNQPLLSQGGYGLLNVTAALQSTDGNWRLSVFANNATDKRYWSNMQFGTGLAVPYTNGMIGEPRTYGIRIERYFGRSR